VFATIFSVVGFEILSLGLHAKTYSWSRPFDRDNRALAAFYGHFKLETWILSATATSVSRTTTSAGQGARGRLTRRPEAG
jgi:hypothetical protein